VLISQAGSSERYAKDQNDHWCQQW